MIEAHTNPHTRAPNYSNTPAPGAVVTGHPKLIEKVVLPVAGGSVLLIRGVHARAVGLELVAVGENVVVVVGVEADLADVTRVVLAQALCVSE